MTGGDIIATLLRDSTAPGLPPAGQIKLGQLPSGVALPALLVRVVSSVDRQPLQWTPGVMVTERVSVTVRAASYRDQVAAMKAVRAACVGQTGNVAGATSVAVLTAGRGPDLAGPADSFEATQDFRVAFIDPA